jgi:hypothetical protein
MHLQEGAIEYVAFMGKESGLLEPPDHPNSGLRAPSRRDFMASQLPNHAKCPA